MSLAAIVGLRLFGAVTMPLLAILDAVGAIGTVRCSVAAPALVAALIPYAQLSDANHSLEFARSAAYTAGPALAGWTGDEGAYGSHMLSLLAALYLAGLAREDMKA